MGDPIVLPLPHATKAYGQLLGRDFNPLDTLLLLRTVRSFVITKSMVFYISSWPDP